ncbi:acetyltransferase [Cryobacterium sp. MLB-32]|uniref:GNAT family N-acetyltransferase n=1 Tax=Cryobacterium sp. MLB-32 TaxID=1529318 RepID=UPI0004E71B1E|nr:GNAT family N-acetyltransferase [Cryobacterium sp. MLB-32]KFF60123.1 acetyltransferase [Cryobacterium sp. MLB-32]
MTTTMQILDHYDSQLRLVVPQHPPAGQTFHTDGRVMRVTGQNRGFIETAQSLTVEGEALDRLITDNRDFFARRGEAVEWKTRGHDRPSDVPERLKAAGFVAEDTETVMVREAHGLAAVPNLPDGVALRTVHTRVDLERIARMESAVWNEDFGWLAHDLHEQMKAEPHNMSVFVAEAAGEVVSAAWLVVTEGTDFAGLWGGSTLPEWRGKGIYTALLARRAQTAHDRGVTYLHVDASDDSTPILRRLGFTAVTTTTPYVWTPPRD